jgi:signal transduction histidine kinase
MATALLACTEAEASVVLWRDSATGELVGRAGADRRESELPPDGERVTDFASIVDRSWPAWAGRVRSFRLPLSQTSDPAVRACLDGEPRRSGEAGFETSPAWPTRLGVERFTAWPLLRGPTVVGAVVLAGDSPSADEARALEEIVLHAGLALESLAARSECRARRAQFATLRDAARGLLQGQGLGSALSRLVQTACTTLEGSGAALWLAERGGAELAVARVYEKDGVEDESVVESTLASLASDVTWRQRALTLDAGEMERRLPAAGARFRPLVAAPVAGLERPRGALFVYGGEVGRDTGEGEPGARELLEVYGLLVGLIVECAAEWERARDAERRLEDLQRERQRLRTAADLGETSVRLAREMAAPLASALGFARRTRRALAEDDPHREYLEIVVREAERLERLVEEHLKFAALARTQLGVVNLNRVVEEVLERSSADLERRRIRLLQRLAADLPPLVLDAEKIESAIESIVQGSLESVPAGGRLLVQTRAGADRVVLEVCHDGLPLGGAIDELFAPFATGQRPGAGLGLALAQRVLRDHGGEIGVHSRGDWGHVVSLALPITENSDRRRYGDRRENSGRDRRGAWSKS